MKKSSTQFVIAKVFGTVLVTLLIAFASCSSPVGQEGEGGINSLAQIKAVSKAPRADFEIYDASDFQAFVAAVLIDPATTAELMDDVNITDIIFAPIGTNAAPYLGEFDGGGYTLTIKMGGTTSFLGLFGRNNGTIQNLRLEGSLTVLELPPEVTINYVGAVAGYNDIGGTIQNVVSTVTVVTNSDAVSNIGGITGFNGWDQYGTESPHVGQAYQPGGVIYQCRNGGQITGGFINLGGIAGGNAYQINQCVNNGAVVCGKKGEGWPGVGGITGRNGNGGDVATEVASITYSYSRGRILDTTPGTFPSQKDGYGCIAGWNNALSNIENCYGAGVIIWKDGEKNPIIGLAGQLGTITNNYSLDTIYTSSALVALTGIRETEAYMQSVDFVDDLNQSFAAPYYYVPNNYPALDWESIWGFDPEPEFVMSNEE
jgi:hypothetical protein